MSLWHSGITPVHSSELIPESILDDEMTMYYKSVEIGSLHLKGNIFAAPMAGYTDSVTRSIALKEGASLAFTEMLSSEALIRNSKRTFSMMKRGEGEDNLAVQLFGSSPQSLGRAAVIAAEFGADLLDLNAGCPVSKVTRKSAGAALGRDIGKLSLAVKAIVESGLPVTVKIRSGWTEGEINWHEAAHAAVEAGASAVCFHPRTRRQGYGGKADWSALKKLVWELPVPVIGSGDLESPAAVLEMFEETGCQAVMIARGAVGNPWIFRQTLTLLRKGIQEADPTAEERLKTAVYHLKAAAEAKGEILAAREMKKHLASYIRGWPSAAGVRKELMRASDFNTLMMMLNHLLSPSSR